MLRPFMPLSESYPLLADKHILTDSRQLSRATTTVFFALRGSRHDGHRFIADLYAAGVRCFVTDNRFAEQPSFDLPDDALWLTTDDTLGALQCLAAYHRRRFSLPVVAITGVTAKRL